MNTTTETEIKPDADRIMDVRGIPCSIKHGAIVRAFQQLNLGGFFVLQNDHDPVRLHDQFAAQWPNTFTWEYLVTKPGDFQVKITKIEPLLTTAVPPAMECGH
jgi:uncharacterized protein (DUF2249 family)